MVLKISIIHGALAFEVRQIPHITFSVAIDPGNKNGTAQNDVASPWECLTCLTFT